MTVGKGECSSISPNRGVFNHGAGVRDTDRGTSDRNV